MYPIFLIIITLQVIVLWLVFTVGSLVIKPRAVKHMVDILISSRSINMQPAMSFIVKERTITADI